MIKLTRQQIIDLFNEGVKDSMILVDDINHDANVLLQRLRIVNEGLAKICHYYPLDIAKQMHSLMFRVYILGLVLSATCSYNQDLRNLLVKNLVKTHGVNEIYTAYGEVGA